MFITFLFINFIHQINDSPTRASLVAQTVKSLPAVRETQVRSLGWEHPLEKEMASHSSILAWKIPWKEEPGRLQSMESQRVGHDWVTSLSFTLFIRTKDCRQPSAGELINWYMRIIQHYSAKKKGSKPLVHEITSVERYIDRSTRIDRYTSYL